MTAPALNMLGANPSLGAKYSRTPKMKIVVTNNISVSAISDNAPPNELCQPHPLFGVENIIVSPSSENLCSMASTKTASAYRVAVSHREQFLASQVRSAPYRGRRNNNLSERKLIRKLLITRIKSTDFAVLMATFGIIITVIEAELTARAYVEKSSSVSIILRTSIMLSTIGLVASVIYYHYADVRISFLNSPVRIWRLVLGCRRRLQIIAEVLICSIAPLPFTTFIRWRLLDNDYYRGPLVTVPIDAVLSLPMFLRCYLICRFIVLHDRRYQRVAVRTIAAMNNVTVNFSFILKTFVCNHPITLLAGLTGVFLLTASWVYLQCERNPYINGTYTEAILTQHTGYDNALWCVIVAFLAIGYGDIVPTSVMGRAVIVGAGLVGTIVTSLTIAIVEHSMELHRKEKSVNAFVSESRIMKRKKEIAAELVQHAWFIHRYNRPYVKGKFRRDPKLFYHQRRFLTSLEEFKRLKWVSINLNFDRHAVNELNELQANMSCSLKRMQEHQRDIIVRLNALTSHVQDLKANPPS